MTFDNVIWAELHVVKVTVQNNCLNIQSLTTKTRFLFFGWTDCQTMTVDTFHIDIKWGSCKIVLTLDDAYRKTEIYVLQFHHHYQPPIVWDRSLNYYSCDGCSWGNLKSLTLNNQAKILTCVEKMWENVCRKQWRAGGVQTPPPAGRGLRILAQIITFSPLWSSYSKWNRPRKGSVRQKIK